MTCKPAKKKNYKQVLEFLSSYGKPTRKIDFRWINLLGLLFSVEERLIVLLNINEASWKVF